MKEKNKILKSFLLATIICSCADVNCNNCTNKMLNEKIIFETDINLFMSNENINNEEETSVNLLLKLNYDILEGSEQFTNEEERKNFFKKAKNYYSELNNNIIKGLEIEHLNYYSSIYSPYISIMTSIDEVSKDEFAMLNEIANNDNIEMIYVSDICNNIPNFEGAKYYSGVRTYVNNGTYTGDGIVVGILEPGILDIDHSNFVNTNITVRDEWYYSETIAEHTTMMGSIIAGTKGVAPDCHLLSVELYGDAVSEIDWLLENGVNVINLSYGDDSPTGNYSSKSAYMDFVVNTYKVSIVASAGNTGESDAYVANPGLGYNVLTVGACSSSNSYARSFSSYKENNGPRKPNITAPGYSINLTPFSGSQNGTSFSAALTTGCVALLMEKYPDLKYCPERVMSLIMASAKDGTDGCFANGLNEYIGAGALNFDKAVQNHVDAVITFSESTSTQSGLTVSLNEGEKFRIVATWLAKADGSATGTSMTNYDIYFYDSNNNLITSQETTIDCVELIELEIPATDTYTIILKKKSTQVNEVEYVSMSYFTL